MAVKTRIDFSTITGVVIAVAAIVGGLLLEKGEVRDIAQYTAAVIVLGGTIGAVMIATPVRVLIGAFRRVRSIWSEDLQKPSELIDEIIRLAGEARKNGIVSLDDQASRIDDPFLRKALALAVDGTDFMEIRRMMELEMAGEEARAHAEAKVFEAAGGYSPTIGIIGAVLGLIQVMKNLANIDEVGHGIAVAFVATVYGVAFANIFFLPMAAKIKARVEEHTALSELKLEGVLGIAEGMNPKLLRAKLEAFDHELAATRAASNA
ncbi:flagellar motor protein [Bryobacterales bacterium F-183]|nr:flagellar motor protein [Bryobacterales bacterium F-183]